MDWEGTAKRPRGTMNGLGGVTKGQGGAVEWTGRGDKGSGQQSRDSPAPTQARTHLVPRQPRAGGQQLLRVPGALPAAQVEEHHCRLQLSQRPAHLRLEKQLEPQLGLRFPLHWNRGDTAVNPPGGRKGLRSHAWTRASGAARVKGRSKSRLRGDGERDKPCTPEQGAAKFPRADPMEICSPGTLGHCGHCPGKSHFPTAAENPNPRRGGFQGETNNHCLRVTCWRVLLPLQHRDHPRDATGECVLRFSHKAEAAGAAQDPELCHSPQSELRAQRQQLGLSLSSPLLPELVRDPNSPC